MIFRADGWWEKAKKRSPRFAAADAVPDHSHIHHAFVVVLLGGGIALVLLTLVQWVAGSYGWELPWTTEGKLATGWLVATLGYVVREVEARVVMGWRYALWDGLLDVWVPALFWVPVATGSAVALWWMMAGYCVLFFLFRPVK